MKRSSTTPDKFNLSLIEQKTQKKSQKKLKLSPTQQLHPSKQLKDY